MFKIENVDTMNHPQLLLIYGKNGAGKTFLGATAPPPVLFVDFLENGTISALGTGASVAKIEHWRDFEELMKFLETPDAQSPDSTSPQRLVINSIRIGNTCGPGLQASPRKTAPMTSGVRMESYRI